MYKEKLAELKRQGRLRSLTPLTPLYEEGHYCTIDGKKMLNLSSNDYLGLGNNSLFLQEFYCQLSYENNFEKQLEKYALGSTSSRLLAGDNDISHKLEELLASLYTKKADTERSALLFNSGYHINIGILPALYNKGDLILSDKLNHASIVDGIRLSTAMSKRYNHLDYEQLRYILTKYRNQAKRAVIVSESVFSMDGDVADIAELIAIKKEFHCELYLDEAHGIGLYGTNGLRKAEEIGETHNIDYLIGVFGKSLASQGSFIICTEDIRKFLINNARSLIFTTALPPVTLSWNYFALQKMVEMSSERAELNALANQLRQELRRYNLQTDGETNIVPVLIGEDKKTVQIAAKMREMSYFTLPIRPPTVPQGSSRIRLSLTAAMRWNDIKELPQYLATKK